MVGIIELTNVYVPWEQSFINTFPLKSIGRT